MKTLRVARTTKATPDQLWNVITDLDRWADRISGITDVTRLDDGTDFGVGTRWRETRIMFGKAATEEMEVTKIDEGRSYTVEAGGRGADYTSVWAIEPKGDETELSMTFSGEPTSLIARIMAMTLGKLFEGATRKAMEKDFDDILSGLAD
ncbi:MAG: SRPBCC family protein [Acidimicrobiia bacterium]|nr:SRPBCC family protein [Acidimicrobiia bacterium]MDH5420464.1 SRPBCC family protein [Acidimicrobiia bacterium]MDH5503805.1 SRPBCC family protein [Acidimicrobiia bacterium]